MATGGEGNTNQLQLGYGSCIWGTGRVTVCPPGPGATQRLSLAGAVEIKMNLIKVEGAVCAVMMRMTLDHHQHRYNEFMMKTIRR